MDIEKLSQAITDYGDARQVGNPRLIALAVGIINSILADSTQRQPVADDDAKDAKDKN